MTIRKIWKTKETEITDEQLQACGNSKVLAVLLKNRGIDTPEKIKNFLNPLKNSMSSPDVFTDMKKAAERINMSVKNNEHITVFGDFDTDGITSTAILYLTLKKIGADVDYYLPDRLNESHGLNTKALVKLIAKRHSKLIITVDCGITNIEEVNFAKKFNTDIIITDHHEAPEILPDAYAIINPKAKNAVSDDINVEELQNLNYLSGAGVVFKLCCKLLELCGYEDFVHEIIPLCAIGTIGDVVELIGENRCIVEMGLELLRNGRHKGVQKLIVASGITDLLSLTSENIAFGVVPRINAAGRLDSPETALKLLISNDDNEINEAVIKLNELNSLRQNLCDETFLQAKEMYEKDKFSNKHSIILFNDNWHIGIIGIVSSKLAELYNKPVFLMTCDVNNPDIIRCSSRSIPELNIYNVLSCHKELFEGFGGHKMAAGFSFDKNKISFDKFKDLLSSTIDEFSQEIDFSKIVVNADMTVEPEDISFETLSLINKLEPYGAGNPEPLFIMNDLTLIQARKMGQYNNHLKLFLSKNNSNVIECVKWNSPDINLPENSKLDILFYPQINIFNGNKSIQYVIIDIHSDYIKNIPETISDIKILDHRNKKDILNQVFEFLNSTKKTTGIFVRSPKLKKELNNYDKIFKMILTPENVNNFTEQIMFFESPDDKDDFVNVIKKTKAKLIHLMNFNNNEINIDNFISTISGMLKYAVSSLNGNLDIKRLSDALCVNEEIIINTLNLFNDSNIIDLVQVSEDNFKITHFNPFELSKIKQNDLFLLINDQISEVNQFKSFYINTPVEKIKEIL